MHKQVERKTTVVSENSVSAHTLPEDRLWKQTAFSENQWAAQSTVKSSIDTHSFVQSEGSSYCLMFLKTALSDVPALIIHPIQSVVRPNIVKTFQGVTLQEMSGLLTLPYA